jgi:general secretion pathway protein E
MPLLCLQITSAATRRTLSFKDVPVVTIGRDPDNVVPLKDDRASRHHCVIQERNGQVIVTDLRSRNGTLLNGQRITSAPLRPGDELKVGSILIELIAQPDAPAGPRRGKGAMSTPGLNDDDKPLPMPPLNVEDLLALEGPEDAEPVALREMPADDPDSRGEGLRRGPDLGAGDATVAAEEEYSPALAARHEEAIRGLLEKLPEAGVREEDLHFINTRGQAVESPDLRNPRNARRKKGEKDSAEKGPVAVLRLLLALCARARASDLHVEPKGGHHQVRMRVDGLMVDVLRLHPGVAQRVANIVKVLCDLDIARNNVVQEGRFSSRLGVRAAEYRVSFAPSVFGQSLAVRVLDHTHTPQRLGELGMPAWMTQSIQAMVRQDSGMLIACGPTGSGKSTTLYAVVREIDTASRKVITIEDPPEFQIDGATQMGINEQQGNTFPALLRSVLRQDPDVIYVGEVRDAETARMALRSAMTGHLVLTTVHARDSLGSIYRLLDLGVEAPLLGQALNLILSQRLVRRLCDACKKSGPLREAPAGKAAEALVGVTRVYHAAGCPRCMNTGYSGRLGIFELLNAPKDLRDLILKSPSAQQLREALGQTVYSSLRESAYQLVARGLTSLDEVNRVLGVE